MRSPFVWQRGRREEIHNAWVDGAALALVVEPNMDDVEHRARFLLVLVA